MHDEAHVLIQHPMPLSDERAVEAWTYIDLSYGSGWERLYVAPADGGRWRTCNIPHHVYGLKFGSVVEIDATGRIARCVSLPDEPCYRLKLARTADRDACLAALADCWIEPMYTTFLGVQPREGQCVETFLLVLDALIEAGLIEDVEDVAATAFAPGPAASVNAAPGPRPGVYEPAPA